MTCTILLLFIILFGMSVIVSKRCFRKMWYMPKPAKNGKTVADKKVSAVCNNTQNVKVGPSHNNMFVSKRSERKISIINTPLPPAPAHGGHEVSIMRLNSKNSLVSDDVDFLTPRKDVGLQSWSDIENEYDAPTFYSKNDHRHMKNYNSNNVKDNYIPMKNY